MAIKSLFAELDHPGEDFRSAPNAPVSTAAECLKGAQESLEAAAHQRTMVYERFSRWIDQSADQPQKARDMLRAIDEQRRKRKDFEPAELEKFDEYLVLRGDRLRAESDVKHWRELIEFWRQREAMGWDRTYGKSSSMRDLVRNLAEAKS